MISLPLLITLVAPAPGGKNRGTDWIQFASRESNAGPRLRIELEDGRTVERAAESDAVVIAYLADRPFGSLKFAAVDLRDQNRALLRFEPPPEGKVRKAELILRLSPSPQQPEKP